MSKKQTEAKEVFDLKDAPKGTTEKEPEIRKEKCREYLRYPFTREEKEVLSSELAEKISKLEHEELRKKEVVKSLDADIQAIKTTISTLASRVKDGYEHRNIDCERIFNYDTRMKSLVRLDTGETVRAVPMTADELQVPLPMPVPSQEEVEKATRNAEELERKEE